MADDNAQKPPSRPGSARPRSARPSSARPRSARPLDNRTTTVVMACLEQLKESVTNAAGQSPEIQEGVMEMLGTLAPIFADSDEATQMLLAKAVGGDVSSMEQLVEILEPKLNQLLDAAESDIAPLTQEELEAGSTQEASEAAPGGANLAPEGGDWATHRAAWAGDIQALKQAGPAASREEQELQDPNGNTVLHVAVLRQHTEAVQVLLSSGHDPTVTDRSGWTPLEAALLLPSSNPARPQLARILYIAIRNRSKQLFEQHKPKLLAALEAMPDFRMKLEWRLDSKLFGSLIKRLTPWDQYTITKQGINVRIDSTLKGLEDPGGDGSAAPKMLKWKRGKLSLVFQGVKGRGTDSAFRLVDHDEQTVIDMMSGPQHTPEALDQELRELLQGTAEQHSVIAENVRFEPAKRLLLGGPVTEKVSGWSTTVYNASAKLKGSKVMGFLSQEEHDMWKASSFDEYLALGASMRQKLEGEAAPASTSASASDTATPQRKKEKSHVLKGRAWVADGFPLSANELVPVLDLLVPANRHLQALKRFVGEWLKQDETRFPVKVQIPLMLSVYANVAFSDMEMRPADVPAAWFDTPASYKQMSITEAVDSMFLSDETEMDEGFEDASDDTFLLEPSIS